MLFIILIGLVFIFGGFYMILAKYNVVKFYKRLEYNQESEWENTTGRVVDTAYRYVGSSFADDNDPATKVMTPIVEYEVNGKKYEGQNDGLASSNVKGASLSIGTEVKVYYLKKEPQKCILKTYIDMTKKSYGKWVLFGIISIVVGVVLLVGFLLK